MGSLARWLAGTFVALAVLLGGCSNEAPEDPPALTAEQLPSLVPSSEDVAEALGVAEVDTRESDGLTQAFEGLDLPEGLESYGYAYTSGDPNSDDDWSAAGLSLVLASSQSEAERLLGELTAAPGWEQTDVEGSETARVQHFGLTDGFTGDRIVAVSGTLLISIDAIGATDRSRADAARSLLEAVLERARASHG